MTTIRPRYMEQPFSVPEPDDSHIDDDYLDDPDPPMFTERPDEQEKMENDVSDKS